MYLNEHGQVVDNSGNVVPGYTGRANMDGTTTIWDEQGQLVRNDDNLIDWGGETPTRGGGLLSDVFGIGGIYNTGAVGAPPNSSTNSMPTPSDNTFLGGVLSVLGGGGGGAAPTGGAAPSGGTDWGKVISTIIGLGSTIAGVGGAGGGPSAPAAPNFADVFSAATNAEAESLRLRNAINAASTLGTRYTDPVTGKVYDFTGLGAAEINAADLQKQLQMAPQTTQLLLDLQKQFGTQFAEEARKQLMATDPTGFNLREQFGKTLGSGANSIESMYSGVNAPQYEQMGGSGPGFERLSGAPGMERVGGAQLSDTGAAAAGRAALETQTFDELSRVQSGAIDPALMAATQQAVRARGAANGSALGDANALQESLAVQLAGQQRADQVRGNAQSLLTSGQTTSDKANALTQGNFENSLARAGFNNAAGQQEFQNRTTTAGFNNQAADTEFQNAMSAINQRNQAKQNQFAGEQGLVGQRASARQQDTANLQSFLGLQPLVSQGGQLSGLQSGAAPFATGNAFTPATTSGTAGNAGTAFAANMFGTQAGMYGQQLQQGNPLQTVLGNLSGAFLGGKAAKMFG